MAFDQVRIKNPAPYLRRHIVHAVLPFSQEDHAQASDTFWVRNPLGDGVDRACSTELSGHFSDATMKTRTYPNGDLRSMRISFPVEIPANSFKVVDIERGGGPSLPTVTIRQNVLDALANVAFDLHPFGSGQNVMLFNGTLGTPVKETGYSKIYRYRARAAQPQETGGHPFWAELHLELFHDMDHVHWWLQWGVCDPRSPEVTWNQGAQADPTVYLIVLAPTEFLPAARIVTRAQMKVLSSGYFPPTHWVLSLDDQNGIYSSNIRHGQASPHFGTLWFGPTAGGNVHADGWRNTTRDAELLGREISACSMSHALKQDANLMGFWSRLPIPEWATTADAVRTRIDNELENYWRLEQPLERGPWQICCRLLGGQPLLNDGRLMWTMRPDNGSQGDHFNYGTQKLWPDMPCGTPSMFEHWRAAMYQTGHSIYWRETDVSQVRAVNHPLTSFLFGGPHTGWGAGGYTDLLGKAGNANEATPGARDRGTSWNGPDEQHFEPHGACQYAVWSGERMAMLLIDDWSEYIQFLHPHRGGGGSSTRVDSTARMNGRMLASTSALLWATNKTHLLDNLAHWLIQCQAQRTTLNAAWPGRTNMALVVHPPNGGIGSAGGNVLQFHTYWRPWEHELVVQGMWGAWLYTNDTDWRDFALEIARAIVTFGTRAEYDTLGNRVAWASTVADHRMGNAVAWLSGTTHLTEAQFASLPIGQEGHFHTGDLGAWQRIATQIGLEYALETNDMQWRAFCAADRVTGFGPSNQIPNGRLYDSNNNRMNILSSEKFMDFAPRALTPKAHGVNLAPQFTDCVDRAFTNVMRCASTFAEYNSSNVRLSTIPQDPRDDGYPATMAAGNYCQSNMLTNPSGAQIIPGPWRLTWVGNGRVSLNTANGGTTLPVTPGQRQLNGTIDRTATAGAHLWRVTIHDTDPADPVRDIRLYYLPYAAYVGVTGWGLDPDFAARMRRSRVNSMRFDVRVASEVTNQLGINPIDFFTVSGCDENGAVDDTSVDHPQWIVEIATQLALRWVEITIPHRTVEDATHGFLNAYFGYLRDELDETCGVIPEVSNERWNTIFPQNGYYETIGTNGFGGVMTARQGASAFDRGEQAYAAHMDIAFRHLRTMFAAQGERLKCLIGIQAGATDQGHYNNLTRMLTDVQGTTLTPPRRVPADLVSPSFYYGNTFIARNGGTANALAIMRGMGTGAFRQDALSDLQARVFSATTGMVGDAARAAVDSMSLLPYEGGDHYWFSQIESDPTARANFYAWIDSADIGVVHDDQYARLRAVLALSGYLQYWSGGMQWGQWRNAYDDGDVRPGTRGMDNEPQYLAFARAGAALLGADVNDPPVLQNPGTLAMIELVPFVRFLQGYDPDVGDTITFSLQGTPPAWLSLNSVTGELAGTPPAGSSAGSPYTITARVTDTSLLFDEETFDVTVRPVNRPPVVTNPGAQATAEEDSVNLPIVATDPDSGFGDVLRYSMSGAPPGLSIHATTGVITGTIPLGASLQSPYTARVRATDLGGLFDEEAFQWTVTADAPVNSPPELVNPGPKTSTVGVLFTPFTLSATDPDLDPITFSMTGGPQGISVNPTTGEVSGTPAAGSSNGSPYLARYRATDDGGLFDEEVNSFIVLPGGGTGGDPPVMTNPGPQSHAELAVVNLVLLAAGGSTPYTWTATGLPPGVQIDGDTGVVTGTVAAGARVGSPYRAVVRVEGANNRFDEEAFDWVITAPGLPQPPTVRQPERQFAYEARPWAMQMVGSAQGGGPLLWSMVGSPTGLVIDEDTGFIQGMPAVGSSAGSPYVVRVTALDPANNLPTTVPFILTVGLQGSGSGSRNKRARVILRRGGRTKTPPRPPIDFGDIP